MSNIFTFAMKFIFFGYIYTNCGILTISLPEGMMDMSKNTHEVLIAMRHTRGYTQEQVAQIIGVSRPSYIAIEAGRKDMTIRQAERVASLLHINIEDLLGVKDGASTFANILDVTEKYKQIILNSIQFGGAAKDSKITKTKLAKIVYLADFIWYYENGNPMSGVIYRKLPRGPVADMYFRALDELEEDGAILREERARGAIMFSLVEQAAPISRLSNDEIALIKKIGEIWRDKPTQDIVNFTHEQLPWKTCGDGEIIPYSLILQENKSNIYGFSSSI
jgi:DNA-binding XRE family transcriptional regulator/uncharacterized phage-associated protein